VFYALGCNGNGVALMSYLGQRIARTLLSLDAAPGAFGEGPFPLSPGGMARSLSVPIGTALYQLDDCWNGRVRGALS
jgi:hypothetical protein